MNPAALIPPADSIPVHWAWLEGFLLLTFGFHLLFMNSVVGSAVIATVRAVTRPQDPAPTLLGKALPSLLALTINFGVAPLLFAQVLYGGFLYTSSVIMAVYWLGLIFVLIAAYYLLYGFSGSRRKKKKRHGLHRCGMRPAAVHRLCTGKQRHAHAVSRPLGGLL